MEVLLLNGSPHVHGCTARALEEMKREFAENGVEVTELRVGNNPVRGCIDCGSCSRSPEHHCVFSDDVTNQVIDAAIRADGIVVGSPVYYSGANGALTAVLDRTFYAAGSQLAFKPAASICSARRAGATATIERLNQYFLMSNMIVVGSTYWAMVHGTTAEEVEQDKEGLQTLRNLARNMTWAMDCFSAGEGVGFDKPFVERAAMTNFVR